MRIKQFPLIDLILILLIGMSFIEKKKQKNRNEQIILDYIFIYKHFFV